MTAPETVAVRPRGLTPADRAAVRTAMVLPAEVVTAKGHGHAGTAMSMAPLAHVLYSRILRHDPADPGWPGRDRFVLSAGHASLLQYVQLFLTGYGLTLDDLRDSRRLGSPTPGHPERGVTPGVELTTGPLGQGVASAAGLALAVRREAARGHLPDHRAPTVWVLAGDGCLQEGVAAEAAGLAGSVGLANLVLLWDDNRITIDGGTVGVFDEDVRARHRAQGWRVLDVADHLDLDELETVLGEAAVSDGRPTLVAVRSTIAVASPQRAGTPAGHAGGLEPDDLADCKEALGFARDATLEELVGDEVLAHTRQALDRGRALRAAAARPRPAVAAPPGVAEVDRVLDGVDVRPGVATRTQNGDVVRALVEAGVLWGGAADVASSAGVAVPGEPVGRDRPDGDLVAFGIREHAMAAALNGVAAHGRWRPYGACYLAFSDYLRPALRLAALSGLPVVHCFSHDSLAVGEDGPTHQPVEQVPSLRAVPGLDVVRPADAAEVLACWRRVIGIDDHPVALVLSRQALPELPAPVLGEVRRGGYVVRDPDAPQRPEAVVAASGSEVAVALAAADLLAGEVAVRVVSVPCLEWFAAGDEAYRAAVLPPGLPVTVVEACAPEPWGDLLERRAVGVRRFGESGAGPEVLARAGITPEAVALAVRRRRTETTVVG